MMAITMCRHCATFLWVGALFRKICDNAHTIGRVGRYVLLLEATNVKSHTWDYPNIDKEWLLWQALNFVTRTLLTISLMQQWWGSILINETPYLTLLGPLQASPTIGVCTAQPGLVTTILHLLYCAANHYAP